MELELAEPRSAIRVDGIDELMDAAALAEDSGVFESIWCEGSQT
jgi:hypothetical protein